MAEKIKLIGKTLDELKDIVGEMGMLSYVAKQIAEWIYKKKVDEIDEMKNISAANRTKLSEKYEVGKTEISAKWESSDGTVKYLFPVRKDQSVETVYIPDRDRSTLCVSSQIGCKMNCLFCMTGKQGYKGNLDSGEIINQIISVPERDKLTNIVFMGMGEPMDNLEELFKAIEILTFDYGYGWSPKRITVSSVGLIPGLKRFLEESKCQLAISLHSPYGEERASLMPVEKAYPLKDLLNLIKQYDFSHQRRLSFEYILLKGLNDDLVHARELVKLISGITCRVNLIPYHAIPGIELKTSDRITMEAFRDYLNSKGVTCTIRASKGEDIFAACGMLSTNF